MSSAFCPYCSTRLWNSRNSHPRVFLNLKSQCFPCILPMNTLDYQLFLVRDYIYIRETSNFNESYKHSFIKTIPYLTNHWFSPQLKSYLITFNCQIPSMLYHKQHDNMTTNPTKTKFSYTLSSSLTKAPISYYTSN